MDQVWSDKVKADNIQDTIKNAILEINKGNFEEITELEEEQNYSSGFNSQRSGDRLINESKYSQIQKSIIEEEDEEHNEKNYQQIQDESESQTLNENSEIIDDQKRIISSEVVSESYEKNIDFNNLDYSTDNDIVISSNKNFELFKDENVNNKKILEEEITKGCILKEKKDISNPDNLINLNNIQKNENENIEDINVYKENSHEIENENFWNKKEGDEANPNTPLINKGTNIKYKEILEMNEQTKDILMKEKELSSFFENSDQSNKVIKVIENEKLSENNEIIENISELNDSIENQDKNNITNEENSNNIQFSWKEIKK